MARSGKVSKGKGELVSQEGLKLVEKSEKDLVDEPVEGVPLDDGSGLSVFTVIVPAKIIARTREEANAAVTAKIMEMAQSHQILQQLSAQKMYEEHHLKAFPPLAGTTRGNN